MDDLERQVAVRLAEPFADAEPPRWLGPAVVGRAKARRRRRAGIAAALAVAAAVAGIVLLPPDADRQRQVVSPGPQRLNAGPAGLHPKTTASGDQIVMPVVFPDGTKADLVFPRAIAAGMARFAVRPYGSGTLQDCCARDFDISTGGSPGFAGQGAAIKTFPGAGGRPVTYWRDQEGGHLLFQFGSWYVSVWDGGDGGDTMTDGNLRAWAGGLRGRTTADGFLVLTGRPPLSLAKSGEHAGPSLTFEDGDRIIEVAPVRRCSTDRPKLDTGPDGRSLQVCRGGIQVTAQAAAKDDDFLTTLGNGFQARNVHPAR